MSLPFAFLAGLFVVVGNCELGDVLPGEGVLDDLVWTSCLLVLPWALAALARSTAARALLTARPAPVSPRLLLRLSALATPLVLHAVFALGAYGDWIDRLAPSSHALRVALALLPLYAVELPRIAASTWAEALVEVGFGARPPLPVAPMFLPRWADVRGLVRFRYGWPLLVLAPALLYGVGADLLALWRPAFVFVLASAAGMSLAAMVFLVLVAAALPWWFRVAFGVARRFPEPAGEMLRETAARLEFSPERLFVLHTGERAVNAMMVGPLPTGRLLCFTDGLLNALDPRSLTGVLAHEVGHARMGHPGTLALLGFVVPVMLLSPLRLLDDGEGNGLALGAGMLGLLLLVWFALQALARRFEHEADVSSVRVLGAEPCSRALRAVTRTTLPTRASLRSRFMSFHPDERARLETMQRYEQDPEFRARFDRGSVRLRRVLALAVAVAVAVGVSSWALDWPRERVLVSFYGGDFVGARRSLEAAGELPPRWQETMARVEEQLDAADQLRPGLEDWESVERALVPGAWQRGEEVLLAEGPAAAHPWFALAVTAMPSVSTTERAIHAYCAAAAAQDPDRVLRLGRIVLRRGAPQTLREVFRGYQ